MAAFTSPIFYFLLASLVASVTAPIIIIILRRVKAGQEILKYVEMHKGKSGTPTMGGFIFIIPVIAIVPIFMRASTPALMICFFASLGFAFLGFWDDFIKIRGKDNQGLRAYQKIIGQALIALVVSVLFYLLNPEGRMVIPFANVVWEFGLFAPPLVFVAIIATTNSVNLTDGIDGLAGGVTFAFLAIIVILISFVSGILSFPESAELMQLAAIVGGGIIGFLLFNSNKAKVFMGDTGSLFLGSMVATIAIFSYMMLFILVIGVMFVLSAVTVIIQVGYFKVTKGKRVFLMTPFHHHLEHKGWGEARIVALYTTVTLLVGGFVVLTFLW